MKKLANHARVQTAADVLLLYPKESLIDQIDLWSQRHPERCVKTSIERSLPRIRSLLHCVDMVTIDATYNPSQATDALLQAMMCLGASKVAMYTEVMHDGLELFIRTHGSLFFLGPLFAEQWEGVFKHRLRAEARLQIVRPIPTAKIFQSHVGWGQGKA
jgi:hypothetical protein